MVPGAAHAMEETRVRPHKSRPGRSLSSTGPAGPGPELGNVRGRRLANPQGLPGVSGKLPAMACKGGQRARLGDQCESREVRVGVRPKPSTHTLTISHAEVLREEDVPSNGFKGWRAPQAINSHPNRAEQSQADDERPPAAAGLRVFRPPLTHKGMCGTGINVRAAR